VESWGSKPNHQVDEKTVTLAAHRPRYRDSGKRKAQVCQPRSARLTHILQYKLLYKSVFYSNGRNFLFSFFFFLDTTFGTFEIPQCGQRDAGNSLLGLSSADALRPPTAVPMDDPTNIQTLQNVPVAAVPLIIQPLPFPPVQ
jgi:hypothetical protein